MDRPAMVEKARKFWQARDTEPTPITMADFALSLLQWKDVADGLPEVEGTYVVIGEYSLSPYLLQFPYELSNKWEKTVAAYIPVPIPEYVKEQR